MLKIIFRELRQYKLTAIMAPIWTSLSVLMSTLIPYVTAFIIDRGISQSNLQEVYFWGGVMLLMTGLNLIFGIRSAYDAAYSSAGLAANLRSAMYENILKMSCADVDHFSTPSLITRMTTDVVSVQTAFQMLLRISVRAPLNILCALVMCMMINIRLSLIFVVSSIILVVSLYLIISHCVRIFAELLKKYDELNAIVRENVQGMRVVKSFVREKHESAKFRIAVNVLYAMSVRVETLMTLNMPVMELVTYGSMIALSYLGARFIVVDGTLTTGQLTSMFSYVMAVLMSLMMLSFIFIQLTMSWPSLVRIAEVIKEKPDMEEPERPIEQVQDGSVTFSNVGFAYQEGGESILKDISFKIAPGESIGILGATGSGKSTLVSLIPRLYDVKEGSVSVGGKDVRSYSLDALRRDVVTVLQKTTLVRGSVLENLRWGRSDATLEECQAACRLAQADGFVSEMPEGYQSHIEQNGRNLSGGQKQRLSIARALVAKPKVLILDDALSAVDTKTEKLIRQSLLLECKDTTLVIISQRIQSIKDCDRIIVLDDGKIQAVGTHDELLESSSIYHEIYELQTSDGEADFDQ